MSDMDFAYKLGQRDAQVQMQLDSIQQQLNNINAFLTSLTQPKDAKNDSNPAPEVKPTR